MRRLKTCNTYLGGDETENDYGNLARMPGNIMEQVTCEIKSTGGKWKMQKTKCGGAANIRARKKNFNLTED